MKRKTTLMYETKLLLIRFLFMGIFGYAVEIWYTTITQMMNQDFSHIGSILGKTHVAALFLYGAASLVYTFAYELLKKIKFLNIKILGPLLRYAIYALLFMIVEVLAGLFLIYIIKAEPGVSMWDYHDKWGNILGLTTFTMFPVWVLAGLFGEFVHKRLLAIDDILLHYKDNVKENRVEYFENKEQEKIEKCNIKNTLK